MRVGIDLGTTYSLIARTENNGRAVLLPDNSDSELFHTPSVVLLNGPNAAVGTMAETLLEQNPELQAIRFFKRNFGDASPLHYDAQGTAWYPETIGALVLKKLRYDAETYASSDLKSAVITVPAHFNDPQRKAVLSAAMLADVPVLGLVEEPVAAAIHYGVSAAAHGQILLVYDFGGGTFDATALSMDQRGVYVLAKSGLTDTGGKELDEAVGAMILAAFERALGAAPHLTARGLLELRRISEEIKIALCMPGQNTVRQTVLLVGVAVDVTIRRADFEARIQQLLERTWVETLKCLRDAGLTPRDVNSVLLVGGSSLVPAVEAQIKIMFNQGQKILFHEPTRAVALGAALHASQLAGEADRCNIPPEFRGVTGYSVGVRAMDPETGRVSIDTLIKKNMPLPVTVRKVYYTSRANQERMVLELVQFSSPGENIVSLGQLVVGPLPSPRQNYPIEVTVENREDGTVAVQAYDSQTGVELVQVFGRQEGGIENLATQRALVRSTFINNL